MDEHTDGFRLVTLCRTARRLFAVIVVSLALHTADANAAGPRLHFDLEAGDASAMLNEFSRQSDLQVLFDFNLLRGMRTRAVSGDLEASTALKQMLEGTNLMFDFVNDHTLAVTPRKPSFFQRLWHRLKSRPKRVSDADDLEQVLISGIGNGGTLPLLGAQTIKLDRVDIDRSPASTVQDYLRTLPQVFGGGPSQDTVLGREAATNSARGTGINLRGLDAGATLILVDGKRIAPSGTAGAFDDISNIPLSIIDHVDVLPDGASAKYGADAIGGVVNLVTRSGLSGLQTQVRGGAVTDGAMGEKQFSQMFGNSRDSGSDVLAFEYFQRDALRSQDRWQYTSDLTPYGGSNFDFTSGSPGTITDGTHFWPLPRNQSKAPLDAASLSRGAPNLFDQYKNTDITPREERWSAFAKESFAISDDVGAFIEGLFTRREMKGISASSFGLDVFVPESNPFYVNPTGIQGPVHVVTGTAPYFGSPEANNRINTGNFAVGLVAPMAGGWTANTYVGYTFEKQFQIQRGLYDPIALNTALMDPNPATAFNPFADASGNNPDTLASISASNSFKSNSNLKTVNLTAAGPLLSLPGGSIESSLGAEYRYQTIETLIDYPGAPSITSGSLTRNIAAAFGEVRVPILGEANQIAFVRRLDLSLGIRRESFSDVGGATVPKVGAFWSFNSDVSFRSTWTRAFKPPNLTDMVAKNSQSTLLTLDDPHSPTGSSTVLALYGTNPDLRPERARTWTFGADWAPKSLPGTGVSLTYFNIRYSGRIDEAQISPDVLSIPSFDWMVSRNIAAAQLADACNKTVYQGPAGTCQSPAVTAILDNRLRNITLLETNGIDIIGKYAFESPAGHFDLGFNGTYIFAYSQANTPGSPLIDIVSTPNNPIKLKARGAAAWSYRGVAISSFVNFQNGYHDTLSVPSRGVSPWTTTDLQLLYEMNGGQSEWLGNTQFVLSAQNLFDVYPPFLNNGRVGLGYDQENADLYGRILSFQVRKKW